MTREFTLSYLTTAPLGVFEALRLAQRLGYYAIGVRLAPLSPGGHFSPLSEDAVLLREAVACIQDTGVAVFDVEGVRLDEQFRRGSFDGQLGVAAELGAQVISVIGDDPDAERLIDSFAHFCDTAAQHHLAVALEFMPYSKVPDSNVALRILRQAQRSNARIAVDFLHVSRSNMTRADLAAIPQECLSYAQLCDAPAEVPTTREGLIHTARCARLLPGAGGIDVRGMVEDLPASLPLSVEIPNTEQLALHGAEEWARRALLATRHAIRNDRSIL
jgi:sugar phosphate isomerase/epimerase